MGLTHVSVGNPADGPRAEEVQCLVDSGAVYSLIPGEVLERLAIRPHSIREFVPADGEVIRRQLATATFEYEGRRGDSMVIVGEPGDDPLLGATTLEGFGLVLNPFRRELRPKPLPLKGANHVRRHSPIYRRARIRASRVAKWPGVTFRATWAIAALMLLTSAHGGANNVASLQDRSAVERARMVVEQIQARGVRDPRVLAAMKEVPRHRFVPPAAEVDAYQDHPLPIGYGQTISQPYIVAVMTELVRPQSGDRALEVGTGSGYQAAVLSRLVSHVYTIEIVEPLGRDAERRLKTLGYTNVTVRIGDGYAGWPEVGPFDVIVVTAAPDHVPSPLVAQLKPGGRLVIPVGSAFDVQDLRFIEKDATGQIRTRIVAPVAFVPLRRGR